MSPGDKIDDYDNMIDDPNATCLICIPLKEGMKCLAVLYLIQSIIFFLFLMLILGLMSAISILASD